MWRATPAAARSTTGADVRPHVASRLPPRGALNRRETARRRMRFRDVRYITLALLVLIRLVHAELWFGKGGVPRVMDLQGKLALKKAGNDAASTRNAQLDAEVRDLNDGREMVE